MSRLKRIIQFFKVWDGVWSVPLGILFFIGAGQIIVSLFGPEAGSMLPVYVQRLFYAALCLVVCNFVVWFGIYMNWRDQFNDAMKKEDQFKDLDPKFKLKMLMLIYFGYALLFTMFLILV